MTPTLRMTMRDGTIRETELTAAQALDLGAGLGLPMHTVRDEQILVDNDGIVTVRESAVPAGADYDDAA